MTDEAARFANCLPIILQAEGGYSNNPSDSGGVTNLGITLSTLSDWLGHPASPAQVQNLTTETVAPIYHARYWLAASCDKFPAGVDLAVFDPAVNMGVGTAVRFLQNALGVAVDGLFGPTSMAALNGADPGHLIDSISQQRIARYHSLSNYPVFGVGWVKRVIHVTDLAKGMIA